MIVLARVDHRLIHGQVAFSWTRFLNCNAILIANDILPQDSIRMTGLRMAAPDGVKLVVKNIEDSVNALASGVTDKYRLMILCESVEDMYRLAERSGKITEINLGGTKSDENRRQVSKAVHLSENDIQKIKQLQMKGILTYLQMVPNDPKIEIEKELF